MGKNDKKSGSGAKGKGGGGGTEKDAPSKAKGAQLINVRHILVRGPLVTWLFFESAMNLTL
jgi:hypothetical protein